MSEGVEDASLVDILLTSRRVDESADVRQSLICAECEREADENAIGWRGYLVAADDDEDEDGVLFFCAMCVAREFSR